MASMTLPIDCFLVIAEHCDVETLIVMERIPALKVLINQNKKSIMKRKHQEFELPVVGSTHGHIIDYIHGKRKPGPIRSTWAYIIPTDSYDSIISVKEREREIEVLLNAPYLRVREGPGTRPIPWPRLDEKTTGESLRQILKRALYRCNAMADLEAQAACEVRAPLPSHYTFDTQPEPWNRDPSRLGTIPEILAEKIVLEDMIPVVTRRKQRAYLVSLPDNELIGIYALCRIVAESWREFRVLNYLNATIPNGTLWTVHSNSDQAGLEETDSGGDEAQSPLLSSAPDGAEGEGEYEYMHDFDQYVMGWMMDQDNDALHQPLPAVADTLAPNITWFEKEVAFQESLLRHGSYFLFGEVRGHGARYAHARELSNLCIKHMMSFETGQRRINHEPGLHMTLMRELRKRLRVNARQLESTVFRRIAATIGAPNSAF